jgi:hypothetical protein
MKIQTPTSNELEAACRPLYKNISLDNVSSIH